MLSVSCEGNSLASSPLAQLLPRLDKLLEGARGRKLMSIDDQALPVGPLVDLTDRWFAEQRQAAAHCFQLLRSENIFRGLIRAASHDEGIVTLSPYLRHTKSATSPNC